MKTRLLSLSLLLLGCLGGGPALAADVPSVKFTTTTQQSFTGGKLLSLPGKAGLGDILTYQRARLRGVVPAARVAFSVNPTAADTITIGGSSFTFKSSLVTATTTTQVKIGASAAATLATLLNAINGVTDTNVVLNTTPFAAAVVADAVSATVLRVRLADVQGGTAIPGVATSTALAASITGGASAWNAANLNVAGKALADQDISQGAVTITSAMVTAGSYDVEVPFTPAFVDYNFYASGVVKARTDAVTVSGNAVHIALAGGSSPAVQPGDVLVFTATK